MTSAIANKIAANIAPEEWGDPFEYIYRWITGGLVTPEEAISFLLETGYHHGIADGWS